MKISEAKQMIYGSKKTEILYKTKIDNFRIVIVNKLGEHPNAYVKVPEEIHTKIELEALKFVKFNERDRYILNDIINVSVHGGITYNGEHLPDGYGYGDSEDGGWWYGWDYAHAYDYVCWCNEKIPAREKSIYEKEWTTEEIIAEALFAVQQIKENYE